ncbi:MAG: YIP1 family protein, partial [Bacteroidota bacterium]
DKFQVPLLVLAGITQTFDRAIAKDLGDKFSLIGVLATCIIVGALLGWISFYFFSALLRWTGSWLNGLADFKAIIRMIAYAMTPSIVALVLLIPMIAIYGNEMFKADGDIISGGIFSNIMFYGAALLDAILGIWSLVLVVVGLSEIQQFSIGKAMLNMVLASVVIIVPLLLVVLLASI